VLEPQQLIERLRKDFARGAALYSGAPSAAS
jgi:hypothetical protein